MVLNAMGPVDFIFGFILMKFGAADPGGYGVTQRYFPSSVVVEQMGFNAGGFTAVAMHLYFHA